MFLGDTQSHLAVGGELVEGGQLQIMSTQAVPEPSTYALLALGLAGAYAMSRRRKA